MSAAFRSRAGRRYCPDLEYHVNFITDDFPDLDNTGIEPQRSTNMSATQSKTLRPQPASAAVGRGVAQAGQDEGGFFNLRDTLSGISVREANFGEFLAALKQRGMVAAKP